MIEKPIVYIITGPTASGKSALAIELAKRLGTEIISADSRQIYKDIPIATAVPSLEEREGIGHHLLQSIELEDYYNASMFEQEALEIARSLLKEKGSAVICGGSMLYIDSFCYGIDDLPDVPKEIRESLEKEWKERGDDWLRGMLRLLDPEYWKRVDLKNMKRIFHAVELSVTTGKPYSLLLTGEKKQREFDIKRFCLEGEREYLYHKINSRVEEMKKKGLIEEAERVYDKRELNSLNTVGLKEIFEYLDGNFTLEEALEKIKRNTRVYARKQITWHKKDLNNIYLDFGEEKKKNIEKILRS